MFETLTTLEKISRSTIRLTKHMPFFGVLVLQLQVVDKSDSLETMATDGVHLYYNDKFVNSLSEAELNWVVVHEVMHPALGHLWRRKNRYPDLWNIACDYEIHSFMHEYLREEDTSSYGSQVSKMNMKMPSFGLFDRKYDGMSADAIYELLLDDYEKDRKSVENLISQLLDSHGEWSDNGGDGEEGEGGENSGVSNGKNQLSKEWEGRVISASQVAQSKSKSSGGAHLSIERLIGKLVNPQKNWRELLAESIVPIPTDYGFTPPDRRMDEFDVFLPDMTEVTDSVGKVMFWIDTSGSMGSDEVDTVFSEIMGCVETFGKMEAYIGCFDYGIHNVKKIEDIEDLKEYKPHGNGGTNFEIPIRYALEHPEISDNLRTIVMLTDGHESFENIPDMDCELIWIITTDVKPPVGKYAPIKVNN